MRQQMSDAIYLREDGTGTEKECSAVVVLPARERATGGKVEIDYFVVCFSGFAICQEKDATHHQEGGQRRKAAHRGTGTQEGPTHTAPSTGDDVRRAVPSQGAHGGRATGQPRPSTTPHHTRPLPHPSLADIPATMRSPLSKIISKKVILRRRYRCVVLSKIISGKPIPSSILLLPPILTTLERNAILVWCSVVGLCRKYGYVFLRLYSLSGMFRGFAAYTPPPMFLFGN
jgi:hypothetical protein